ncbi:MAG: hypothetical protein ACM31D_19765 [Bacteroidota bacterium]
MLDQYGINLLVPPRNDIRVGDLLIAENNQARRAEYRAVFGCEPKRSAQESDAPTSMQLTESGAQKLSVVARVVSALFPKSKGSASARSDTGTSFTMRPIAPHRRSLKSMDDLLQQLRDSNACVNAAYENYKFYVVTEIFNAKGLEIVHAGSVVREAEAKADIDDLSSQVSASVHSQGKGSFTFKADEHLTFGVRLRRIYFEGGVLRDSAADHVIRTRNADTPPPPDFISDDDAFIELE